MTPADVLKKVIAEIDGRWETSNAHGVDLRRCLVDPTLVSMNTSNPVSSGVAVEEAIAVWIVLEEHPDTRDGYKVVLEEETGDFGLAMTCEDGELFYIGPYGDFMTTLRAM